MISYLNISFYMNILMEAIYRQKGIITKSLILHILRTLPFCNMMVMVEKYTTPVEKGYMEIILLQVFIYPDTSHIVVHQTIKNGSPYEYLTDTIFLHNSSQIDSVRKYNDISYSAPSTYFYSQCMSINDTMPNMFYKLSTRQADLYAPRPGQPASFNISLFNSFNRLLFKSYTDNISVDNSVYFWPYLFYPNKAPELIYETYDSSGYFTRNHYLFNYKH